MLRLVLLMMVAFTVTMILILQIFPEDIRYLFNQESAFDFTVKKNTPHG
jgi:hypothetical protein